MRTIRVLSLATIAAAALASPGLAQTQAGDTDAFADAATERFFTRARAARTDVDRSIRSYDAIVRQRVAAALRMPLKDRTLYREESAARVRWYRDAPNVVEILAARQQHPGGVEVPTRPSDFGADFFDPAAERIYLGFETHDDDSHWIVHPLAANAEAHYRYRTGDTLAIAFPDGRRLRVVELRVLPRERTPRLLSGSFWIEPESGALVQAVYRLARDLDLRRDFALLDEHDDDITRVQNVIGTIEFRIGMIVVEYSLWNFRHWLPRLLRADGLARVGAIRFPFEMEIAYDVSDVVSSPTGVAPDSAAARAEADSVFTAWRAAGDYRGMRRSHRSGRAALLIVPRDPALLATSPELPPAIWRDAPEFAGDDELRELRRALDRVAGSAGSPAPVHVDWSIARPASFRYNRVEGLSLGARVSADASPYGATAEARIGTADRVPNAWLELGLDGARVATQLAGFHALRSVDEGDGAFGFGASVAALLLGRDDAEYYRATGASLGFRPAELRRASWRFTLEAARHRAVKRNTDFSLPSLWQDGRTFRETIVADEGVLYGADAVLAPWWGTDPLGWQGGVELMLHAATGDFDFARGRLTLRVASPLPGRLRAGLEVAGGTATGDVPAQHLWYLGGPASVRGYAGNSARGESFARARLDVTRGLPAVGLALFSDAGWAGERNAFRGEDALLSLGIGMTVLDGLVRIDLARALRRAPGWRLELYLDALL
jgi:hypothetical protein